MPEGFFDFESVTEQKNDLDYGHLIDCPHCKKPIPQDATICYYCGRDVDFSKQSKFPYWLILFIIVLLAIVLFF